MNISLNALLKVVRVHVKHAHMAMLCSAVSAVQWFRIAKTTALTEIAPLASAVITHTTTSAMTTTTVAVTIAMAPVLNVLKVIHSQSKASAQIRLEITSQFK